jgi:putative phosphoribosyl transferase
MRTRRFRGRIEAGRLLAERLSAYAGRSDTVVLGLPRGGVPVAYEVAAALRVPLDVFLVRKLGVPGHEELAMGAIATGGVRVLNDEVVRTLHIAPETVDETARREGKELERREKAYRGDRPPPEVRDRVAVLVDDGLATGSTMRAAMAAVRQLAPSRTVVAVPTGAPSTCREIGREVDEVVCLLTPEPFHAVGLWYDDFSPTTDGEIGRLLGAATPVPPPPPADPS